MGSLVAVSSPFLPHAYLGAPWSAGPGRQNCHMCALSQDDERQGACVRGGLEGWGEDLWAHSKPFHKKKNREKKWVGCKKKK